MKEERSICVCVSFVGYPIISCVRYFVCYYSTSIWHMIHIFMFFYHTKYDSFHGKENRIFLWYRFVLFKLFWIVFIPLKETYIIFFTLELILIACKIFPSETSEQTKAILFIACDSNNFSLCSELFSNNKSLFYFIFFGFQFLRVSWFCCLYSARMLAIKSSHILEWES